MVCGLGAASSLERSSSPRGVLGSLYRASCAAPSRPRSLIVWSVLRWYAVSWLQEAVKAKNAAAKKGGAARATAVRAKATGAKATPVRAVAAKASPATAKAVPAKAVAAKAVAAPAPAVAKPSASDNVADLLSSMGAVSDEHSSLLPPPVYASLRAAVRSGIQMCAALAG